MGMGYGYGGGNQDQKAERERRLAERASKRADTEPAKKKGGRPKDSKNKANG